MSKDKAQSPKSEDGQANSHEVDSPLDQYGKRLLDWLYSDPEYAHRLDHEGSGNW